ncbi:MAG TPA: hypothetical protein DIS76_06030 [Rhodospirillaceae bacterium]|nr:hypothetical protein [Rhodospirillaceae bacterium]
MTDKVEPGQFKRFSVPQTMTAGGEYFWICLGPDLGDIKVDLLERNAVHCKSSDVGQFSFPHPRTRAAQLLHPPRRKPFRTCYRPKI